MASFTSTAQSAYVEGIVLPNGVETSAWFEWGEEGFQHRSPAVAAGSGVAGRPIAEELTGLAEDRVYMLRTVTESGTEISHGDTLSFRTSSITGVAEDQTHAMSFRLQQNYPNPFNPGTKVSYSLPHQSIVHLEIFDILGRKVSTLVDGRQQPGDHVIDVDMQGQTSGIYICRLLTDEATLFRKMLLIR
jgi:hypothetical protein